jgi:hypothetical protein
MDELNTPFSARLRMGVLRWRARAVWWRDGAGLYLTMMAQRGEACAVMHRARRWLNRHRPEQPHPVAALHSHARGVVS